MKRTMFQRVMCLLLSATILFGVFAVSTSASEGNATGEKLKNEYGGYISSLEDMKALVDTVSYDKYIENYLNIDKYYVTNGNSNGITVNVKNDIVKSDLTSGNAVFVENVSGTDKWENFGGDTSSVYLPATNNSGKAAAATWNFDVEEEEAGLYYLYIEYYNCKTDESSVSAIQRKLMIDGKVPFSEVKSISFDKTWQYKNFEVLPKVEYDEDDAFTKDGKLGTYVYYKTDKDKDPATGKKYDAYYKIVEEITNENGKLMIQVTKYKMLQDIVGNSMTPEVEETSQWNTYVCRDASGYHDGYFAFYLPSGSHTITLEAEREPMVIKSITFVPASKSDATAGSSIPTYSQYIEQYKNLPAVSGDNVVRIEAEFPDAVSDASVIPSNSNDSAANYPMSHKAQLFNVIGETSYSAVGQWAAYKFTVNETGMYSLAMRYKQDALQGMFICRSIKIAGGSYDMPELPFAEASNVRFDYTKDWVSKRLSFYDVNGDAQEFKLYLEAGVEYTLYLECSLGDLRDYIRQVETVLSNVNECYLRILQRTGSTPDPNQDYGFATEMKDVLDTLIRSADELSRISGELEDLCGTTGSHLATLDTVERILRLMGSNYGNDIAANMSNLKTHLGTLGTWVNDSKKGSLLLDNISVVPADKDVELPKAKAGFFKTLWHEISSFIYSFFTNYEHMGLTVKPDANTETVDVWLAMGRDQSQIWRTMIDSDGGFTDETGNAVALKLVTAGTLLPSILAGKGPDVYLGLGSADVINYAIRDAIVGVSGNDRQLEKLNPALNDVFTTNVYKDANGNLREFTDAEIKAGKANGYEAVSLSFNATWHDLSKDPKSDDYNNFAPAAMNTLELLEVTYGIPMTMTFAMMFYRMDVLAELNKEVPETWDQLLSILPDLQTNNMTIGVSYISALDFMMYQQGGNMWKYANDPNTNELVYDPYCEGSKIDLDSDIALKAFEFVCRLYTDYSLPVSYDASNRFRTGEMPIVIGDYIGTYNTLVVFATEIGGLWEFSSLPGSEYYTESGEYKYNYNSLAGVSATVIPYDGNKTVKQMQAAWEFIQWQTSREAQATYGNKIVALIGPAAKYETANIKAIEDLSWTAKEKEAIRDQMHHLDAIVNYPGSYIYSRYMKFAFLDAYNDGARPHEAMMSYIPAINAEIARKREEFGLPVAETEEEALYPSKLAEKLRNN